MPTISVADCVGWFAVILIGALIAVLGWPCLVFVTVLGGISLWMVPKIDHRASERRYRASERRRLLVDCDRQHAEVMAGQVIIPGRLWTGNTPIDPQWSMTTGSFTTEGRL